MLLADFQNFDVILAMDNANLAELHRICPPEHAHKLALFLADVDGLAQSEVPDPYFGSTQGFERVMDLCETGARALIKRLG